MTITKGEFTRFSLKGRIQLLKLYGSELLCTKKGVKFITIYAFFDFYVEVVCSNWQNGLVLKAEPMLSSLVKFYMDQC